MYTNTKKSKKLILVLVLLMLFNFVYPINVKAAEDELLQNIVAAPAKIFFEMEKGVISFLNNVFTRGDSRKSTTDDLKIHLTPETIIKANIKWKNKIKKYCIWMVLCPKKFSYSWIAFSISICWYKNGIINYSSR